MAGSGCEISPPIVALYFCSGWSFGNVKDHYLCHNNTGYQFCTRVVT